MLDGLKKVVFLQPQIERFSTAKRGALAQLARALAWHARGHRFDSVMLHNPAQRRGFFIKEGSHYVQCNNYRISLSAHHEHCCFHSVRRRQKTG